MTSTVGRLTTVKFAFLRFPLSVGTPLRTEASTASIVESSSAYPNELSGTLRQ